jgi:carbon storage regulator
MLVLSRFKNEGIIINGNVRVVVVDIRGEKVRLGIEADPSIPVHREEIQNKLDQQSGGRW